MLLSLLSFGISIRVNLTLDPQECHNWEPLIHCSPGFPLASQQYHVLKCTGSLRARVAKAPATSPHNELFATGAL